MTLVKFCGLQREEDAYAVNQSGADLAGVILSAGFRRTINWDQAERIRAALLPEIPLTGVFVNDTEEVISRYVMNGVIERIQLHGQETNELIDHLHQELPGVPVMKAFVVKQAEDIQAAERSHADFVILDGGTGEGTAFSHELIGRFPRPYFLAGGITAENAAEVIRTLHPYGLDTSSGIETDGRKDPVKMKAFMEAVRKEDRRG